MKRGLAAIAVPDVLHEEAGSEPASASPRSSAARRFGYLVSAGLGVVALYIAHHLLVWGWPAFLTVAFDDVLPILSASIVVGIATNLVLVVGDPGWLKALVNAVTAAFGFAVARQTLLVYPFDFSGYDHDWSWVVSLFLALSMVGAAIGGAIELVRFLTWPLRRSRARLSIGPERVWRSARRRDGIAACASG